MPVPAVAWNGVEARIVPSAAASSQLSAASKTLAEPDKVNGLVTTAPGFGESTRIIVGMVVVGAVLEEGTELGGTVVASAVDVVERAGLEVEVEVDVDVEVEGEDEHDAASKPMATTAPSRLVIVRHPRGLQPEHR